MPDKVEQVAPSVPGLDIAFAGAMFQAGGGGGPAEGVGLLAAVVILLVAFGSVLAMGLPVLVALFGAGIHWIAPALGPDWYAFLHAPDAAVASARNGTAFGPLGAIAIGALMFACTLFALSGRGDIGYLPFTRAALAVISFICLVRGLIIIPYIIILPSVPPFLFV